MGKPRNKTQQLQDKGDRIRRTVINWLADMLTDPACPLEANDLCHFRLIGQWFGGSEAIRRLAAAHDDKPQLRDEVLLSVVVEALDRLLA